MAELFLKIVNMSISASWLVLAVVVLRLLLKKAPKWVNVLLWGLVAFRLVCPFTLESALSLIPSAQTIPEEIMREAVPAINSDINVVNTVVNPVLSETFSPEPVASANPLQIWIPILAVVWCLGMAAMAEYTLISYWRLHRKVRMAIQVKDNIYLSEYVASPFVLGVFKPKIYLPYHMNELDRYHVIAHERTHIRRKDHWWKPLGFLLLTVHWFNPLMWPAYILLCRDIELACDEKVIQELGAKQRADYSQALLNCSISHRSIAACPVAFGEVGVKERVKNVLSYKKPAFWIVLIAVIACVVVAVCFLTDPKESEQLRWLQELEAKNVSYIEYRDPGAAAGKQYTLYEGDELTSAVEILNSFEGNSVNPVSLGSLVNEGTMFTIATNDGRIHNLQNYGNTFLCIDGNFFTDVHNILDTVWDPYFQGTTYYPAAENSDLGVSMEIEELSPTGVTVLFTQYDDRKDYVLFGGNDYFLQKEVDGVWEPLLTLVEPIFTTDAYTLDNIRRHKIDWEWLYGSLSGGHYRIGKSVSLNGDKGMRQSGTVYAEFDIEGSDDWDIDLNIDWMSAAGITFEFDASNDAVEGAFYYESASVWLDQDGEPVYAVPMHEPETEQNLLEDPVFTVLWNTELPAGNYRAGIRIRYVSPSGEEAFRTHYIHFGVTAEHQFATPLTVLQNLNADTSSGSAKYLRTGGGYNFLDYMTEELVEILKSLNGADIIASPGIVPDTSITLSSGDLEVILESDGEHVELSFDDKNAVHVGNGVWAVKNDELNEFFAIIDSYAPGNRTYKVSNTAPLAELPRSYTLEEASIDGVVTMIDGDIADNADVWEKFVAAVNAKTPASVRIMKYHHADGEHPASQAIFDLEYDGSKFTLCGVEDGELYSLTYGYLRYVEDTVYPLEREYDEYRCYYLIPELLPYDLLGVNNIDIDRFTDPRQLSDSSPFIVCCDLVTYPEHPAVPSNVTEVSLVQEGNTILSYTDASTVKKLSTLFANAEGLKQKPPIYSDGLDLDLVFTGTKGLTVSVELDWENDYCCIDGVYYDYGPDRDARAELYGLLGISYSDTDTLRKIKESLRTDTAERLMDVLEILDK